MEKHRIIKRFLTIEKTFRNHRDNILKLAAAYKKLSVVLRDIRDRVEYLEEQQR